jgi:hypothetical protein
MAENTGKAGGFKRKRIENASKLKFSAKKLRIDAAALVLAIDQHFPRENRITLNMRPKSTGTVPSWKFLPKCCIMVEGLRLCLRHEILRFESAMP